MCGYGVAAVDDWEVSAMAGLLESGSEHVEAVRSRACRINGKWFTSDIPWAGGCVPMRYRAVDATSGLWMD